MMKPIYVYRSNRWEKKIEWPTCHGEPMSWVLWVGELGTGNNDGNYFECHRNNETKFWKRIFYQCSNRLTIDDCQVYKESKLCNNI